MTGGRGGRPEERRPDLEDGMIRDGRIRGGFETDVLVVGLGFAGSAAVRAARESGADVIGLEACPLDDFAPAGRDVCHVNSRFLRSRLVPEADADALALRWADRAGSPAGAEMLRDFFRYSGQAFDWYTDMFELAGAEVLQGPPEEGGGGTEGIATARFPRSGENGRTPALADFLRANLVMAQEQGADLFFGMTAVRLEIRDDGGVCVTGRSARNELYRYSAKKGVVLCCGMPRGPAPADRLFTLEGMEELACAGLPASRDAVRSGAAVTAGRLLGRRAAALGEETLFT